MISSGWWKDTMETYFGTFESLGNFMEGKVGCSQFIVSRERVRALPREFYVNMYNWIVNNTVDERPSTYNPKNLRRKKTVGFMHPRSNYHTSRFLEWTWELIFTRPITKPDITDLLTRTPIPRVIVLPKIDP